MSEFEVYTSCRLESLHLLKVQPHQLTLSANSKTTHTYPWIDVLSIRSTPSDSQLPKLELILFPLTKKFLRAAKRTEQSIFLYTNPENEQLLIKAIRKFITRTEIQRPKLLLFHNPIAGSNSNQHFEICLEFLGKTHFRWEVIRTEYRGHCQEYLEKIQNPEEFYGVVIISGDGLMHEFVNSLVQIPVVHVPAGSGNAFARTQAQEAGENCGTKQNLYMAIKGQTKRFSLTKYTLQKIPQPVYSCLSLQWGFLADVDMQSQVLRFLGGLRFQVYSFYRILMLRSYRGTLSYSYDCNTLPPLSSPLPKHFTTVDRLFYNAIFCSIPWITDKYNIAPLQNSSNDSLDMQYCLASNGKWQFAKYLFSMEGGKSFDLDKREVRDFYKYQHGFVKSFRLVPRGQNLGVFGIDGEKYDAQAVQGEVLQDRMSMFTLTK